MIPKFGKSPAAGSLPAESWCRVIPVANFLKTGYGHGYGYGSGYGSYYGRGYGSYYGARSYSPYYY